jgi:hypothetical protein
VTNDRALSGTSQMTSTIFTFRLEVLRQGERRVERGVLVPERIDVTRMLLSP